MYLTQLTGKQLSELEQMREQLGENRFRHRPGTPDDRARAAQDSYLRLRRMGLRAERLPAQLVPAPWKSCSPGDEGDFSSRNTLNRYAEILPGRAPQLFSASVRRHNRMVRGLEDGEEIDLDRNYRSAGPRALMGETSRRAVFTKRARKKLRDVATLFPASTCRPRPTSLFTGSRAKTVRRRRRQPTIG